MAGGATGGQGSPTGYARELLDLLAELRAGAGSPSLRSIAGRIPATDGHTSVGYLSQIFRGLRLPSADMAVKIVEALRGDENVQARAQRYAESAARDARDTRRTGTPSERSTPWLVERFETDVPRFPDEAAPSVLLSARYQVVDFIGRQQELTGLTRWRDDDAGFAVHLLHASGGHGKTRLAAHLARRSAEAGWSVGSAQHGAEATATGRRMPQRSSGAALLVIVDYAERWPMSDLLDFIVDQRRAAHGRRVRLLLLARPTGGWWQGVRAALIRQDIAAVTEGRLQPLATTADDRVEAFTWARDCFAAALGVPAADAAGMPPPRRLTVDEEFARVLTVHMGALAAVYAFSRGGKAPRRPDRLSRYLLDRERLHWQQMRRKTTRDEEADEAGVLVDPSVMARMAYTATLVRPVRYRDAVTILRLTRIDDMAGGADKALRSHAVCYPPSQPGHVLEPLYPDRLGEDFLALQTSGHEADGYRADPWAADTIATVLTPGDGALPAWAAAGVAVLIEASARWSELASGHLYPLLRDRPDLGLAAGGAALIRLSEIPAVDLSVLEAIEALLPDHPHVDFDTAAAAISTRLIAHRLPAADIADRARLHAVHAWRLTNAGHHEEALTANLEATGLYRQLAAADAPAHEAELAKSLNNLGTHLAALGRHKEALPPTVEAVQLRRRLAETKPDEYRPQLAMSLSNLGLRLSALGRRDEAYAASHAAVQMYRQLADADPVTHEPDFAMSLTNLGINLSLLRRHEEALAASEEAVELYRRLATTNAAVHEPDLSLALNNLGIELSVLGHHDEALAATRDAVAIRRRLTEANPAAYESHLAASLNNLGIRLLRAGRLDDAVVAAHDAADHYRRLAEANPVVHRPQLAKSLTNLSILLSGAERRGDALLVGREAVAVLRTLASHDPQAHRPGLAAALTRLGSLLAESGHREAALAAEREAQAIRLEGRDGPPTPAQRRPASPAGPESIHPTRGAGDTPLPTPPPAGTTRTTKQPGHTPRRTDPKYSKPSASRRR